MQEVTPKEAIPSRIDIHILIIHHLAVLKRTSLPKIIIEILKLMIVKSVNS